MLDKTDVGLDFSILKERMVVGIKEIIEIERVGTKEIWKMIYIADNIHSTFLTSDSYIICFVYSIIRISMQYIED